MIADFVIEKMTAYISGGMEPATAGKFTRGELGAIYKGNHYSRDGSGAMQPTPPPEALGIEEATAKCEKAILDFIKQGAEPLQETKPQENTASQVPDTQPPTKKREGMEALEYMLSHGIPLIGNYESGATINKGKAQGDPQENAYTSDLSVIKSLMAGQGDTQGRAKGTQIKRFSFRPCAAGLFCLDIDRKPGKPDGLKELQKIFDLATLPDELKDIEAHFPCYVKTPNNGYHLYFKYTGAPIKKADLFTSIELKHDQLTAPGSVNKDGKPYVLSGAIENAPPLFGLILDKIQKAGKQAGQEKQAPQKAAADRASNNYTPPAHEKPRITLDDLAMETSGGNHDRQVQFAGKAFRCKYTADEALAYAKSRADIFGTGTDTANTIYSVFRDNGGNVK